MSPKVGNINFKNYVPFLLLKRQLKIEYKFNWKAQYPIKSHINLKIIHVKCAQVWPMLYVPGFLRSPRAVPRHPTTENYVFLGESLHPLKTDSVRAFHQT